MPDRALSDDKKTSFLLSICEAVSKSNSMNAVMDDVISCLVDYIGVDAACMYIAHAGSCTLSWAFGIGSELAATQDIRSVRQTSGGAMRTLSDGTVGHVLHGRHRPMSFEARLSAVGLPHIVWIPLVARGEVLGVLALARGEKSVDFSRDHDDLLLTVGRQLGTALVTVCNADLITRLQQAEAKHRFLYDDTPAMYLALDVDGIITQCNTAVLRALGYSGDDLIGRSINTLLEGFDEEVREAKSRDVTGNARVDFESVVRDKEGKEHEVLALSRTLYDDANVEVGAILILEDVTERNRLESENQYKSLLVDNATDTMFVRVIDDGSILYANEASWKTRGYTREEFMKLLPKDLSPKEFQEGDRLLQLHQEFLRAGGYTVVAPQLCKDGWIREMEITSRLLKHKGKILATVIMRDLTERNRLQREMERADRIESLGRLAGGLAHDFNNMLVGIIGHASLLKAQSAQSSQTWKSADTIEKTASHAAEIVSRLMVFARGEEPKLELINLNDVAEDVSSLLSGSLSSDVRPVKVLDPDIPFIEADRTQIMQCALNLCLNALDAMPNGGTLTIKTFKEALDKPAYGLAANQFLPPGRYAGFTVRDSGIGMDDQTLRKVFEPYFTTKDSKEGHGFGLATTYGIVKRHGGYINVRSIPGFGTRFTMFFPAVDAPERIREQEPERIPAGHGTILVVEDDETVRDFLNTALGKAGYSVILAEDGPAALEQFSSRATEIDAVILDLVMPGMSGLVVCEEMKKMDPEARILISSGYSDSDQKIEGVCGYLRKPYRLQELLKAVAAAVDKG